MDYTITNQIKKKESLDYLEGFRDASLFIAEQVNNYWEVGTPSHHYSISNRLTHEFTKNKIKTLSRVVIRNLFEDLVDDTEDLAETIERYTEDYTNEILAAMECHEASTHFEDYMNKPIESQTSDTELPYENCMSRHNDATSSIECLECNCLDCPYSRG